MDADADRVMIPIRLLGFEGETVLNTSAADPQLEVRRLAPPRLSPAEPEPQVTLVDRRVERYRVSMILTRDDGGPLVIYRRYE